ncbi:flagellar hook-length control protein FliK [Vibrio sp. D431a]|uniref:flagellar hook-length control protein FliK n=1 Tax=Vibrio sp. D431a TaxID=2837388 RepID=UPI0025534519|nr:flagellar hook-length control protein FliK [Vibrio sp. D431a]MDK9790588.1 flagellar hook-length control protein FliK [Vibrio sp. D431a]
MRNIPNQSPMEQLFTGKSTKTETALDKLKENDPKRKDAEAKFGNAIERANVEVVLQNPKESTPEGDLDRNHQVNSGSVLLASETKVSELIAQQESIVSNLSGKVLPTKASSPVEGRFEENGFVFTPKSDQSGNDLFLKSTDFIKHVLGIKANTSDKSSQSEFVKDGLVATSNDRDVKGEHFTKDLDARWSIQDKDINQPFDKSASPTKSPSVKVEVQQSNLTQQVMVTELSTDADTPNEVRQIVRSEKTTLSGIENSLRNFAQEISHTKQEKISSNELKLTLRPVHLGEVKVEVIREQDKVRVNVITSTDEAKQYINQNRETLTSTLSESLGKGVDVNIGNGSDKHREHQEKHTSNKFSNKGNAKAEVSDLDVDQRSYSSTISIS